MTEEIKDNEVEVDAKWEPFDSPYEKATREDLIRGIERYKRKLARANSKVKWLKVHYTKIINKFVCGMLHMHLAELKTDEDGNPKMTSFYESMIDVGFQPYIYYELKAMYDPEAHTMVECQGERNLDAVVLVPATSDARQLLARRCIYLAKVGDKTQPCIEIDGYFPYRWKDSDVEAYVAAQLTRYCRDGRYTRLRTKEEYLDND